MRSESHSELTEIAPTNEEKPLLDESGELLEELVHILTEVFETFATDGQLELNGATEWVMRCNHWQRDYSIQLAREILNRHSDAGFLTVEEFLRFYQQAAKQHPYHVRKDLKQLGYVQYRPLLGKALLTKENRLEDDCKRCLTRIFKKFAKLDEPPDLLTLRGATEWVMKCNTWDQTRAQQFIRPIILKKTRKKITNASQLATELLRTHGSKTNLTMTREQFLKYYRLASTQHPVHVRKDLEELGYEVYKLAPMLTEDKTSLTEDMLHVSEDIFYQFADVEYLTMDSCTDYVEACFESLDENTRQRCAQFLLESYGTENGIQMEGFKRFVFDATLRDEDGMRQDLYNLGYKGYAP